MKSTLRHYAPVALMLAVILAASSCLSLITGGGKEDSRTRVLTTTYPLYVAAQNILGDTDEVRLEMLSGVGAGCLHDYQLTPADRLALERAEVILTNGAGSEPFLEGVDPARVVNTAAGIDLICSTHHHHEGEDHHHEENNEHVWVSPDRYGKQVLAVLNTLIALDSANEAVYRSNAENYLRHVDYLWQQMQSAAVEGRPCILFHDSLAYLAADLGWEVQLVLTVDGDSGIAAEDLAAVEVLAKEHPDLLLIYDTQYPIRYTAVDGLVPDGQVIALETAVVGDGKPSDWLDAMGRNAEKLQKLTGGDAP